MDSLSLDEGAGVVLVVGDDLVDGVQDGHHCVSLQVLGRVLLSTGEVPHQVPNGIVPCRRTQDK